VESERENGVLRQKNELVRRSSMESWKKVARPREGLPTVKAPPNQCRSTSSKEDELVENKKGRMPGAPEEKGKSPKDLYYYSAQEELKAETQKSFTNRSTKSEIATAVQGLEREQRMRMGRRDRAKTSRSVRAKRAIKGVKLDLDDGVPRRRGMHLKPSI